MRQQPFFFDDVCRYDWPAPDRKRRKRTRKPTLRGVMAQAMRAGVQVASVHFGADGITLTPGKATDVFAGNIAVTDNPWDTVLQ